MRETAADAYCKLRFCKKCKYVWETGYCNANRMSRIYKYKELSSYKLKRETCKECERSKNERLDSNKRTKKLVTQYF